MNAPVASSSDLLRNSRAAARAARLRYVSLSEPGIERRRVGSRFIYMDRAKRPIRDRAVLKRLAKLAVPPAWTQVWLCSDADGHIQATGIDAKGRKQYRYHPRWRAVRDLAKYQDILPFVQALPRLRRKLCFDLQRPGLTKDKVVATILRLMEQTQIRVGNDRYARANDSFGLTTLLDRHARISNGTLQLKFRGKGGKLLAAQVKDRLLASAVRRCRDVPGQRLFQYYDARGQAHSVTSSDVNAYIRAATGQAFTAKEFRTWAATYLTAMHLAKCGPCGTQKAAKQAVQRAIELVSTELGNTVAICRKCYIDPVIFDSYLAGELAAKLRSRFRSSATLYGPRLSPAERAVSEFLTGMRGLGVKTRVAAATVTRVSPARALRKVA